MRESATRLVERHLRESEPVAFSNAVRLKAREWIGVILFGMAVVVFAPSLWERVETFDPGPDFRIPDDLKTDYWLYDRWTHLAGARADVLVLGDSVPWGLYVPSEETLSHYLNVEFGGTRCANLGVNGMHPVALVGLLEHYAGGVTGKKVLLQCNPLWLTSVEQDLQDEELPREIFHSQLIPQFSPGIPRYRAEKVEVTTRLGIVIGRQVPFLSGGQHLQLAYFNQKSIPAWTLDHPKDDPIGQLTGGLKMPKDELPLRRELTAANFKWLDPDHSLQWHSFQTAVAILQQRGNHVFVLLGPFNEHILTAASRERYQEVKQTMENWLMDKNVPHLAPAVLQRELYGDASHPLAAGYRMLARELRALRFFDE
jgi:hypothetical protein